MLCPSRHPHMFCPTSHRSDPVAFRADLINIARTTLSSKILANEKQYFADLAVNAVLRLKASGNLEAIQVIKIAGGQLSDSYLDDGFLLAKKIGVNQPKRLENARILIANTSMDTDKVKVCSEFSPCVSGLVILG